jgi:chromosome segregation ATPase
VTLKQLSIREWKLPQDTSYERLEEKIKKGKNKTRSLKRRAEQLESDVAQRDMKISLMEGEIKILNEKIASLEDQADAVGQVQESLQKEVFETQKVNRRLCDDLMRFEDQQERLDFRCSICKEHALTTALFPCRHLSFCKDCAQGLVDRGEKCPVCRHQVLFGETFFVK